MKFLGSMSLVLAFFMALRANDADILQEVIRISLKGLVYAIIGGSLLIAGYLKDIKEK